MKQQIAEQEAACDKLSHEFEAQIADWEGLGAAAAPHVAGGDGHCDGLADLPRRPGQVSGSFAQRGAGQRDEAGVKLAKAIGLLNENEGASRQKNREHAEVQQELADKQADGAPGGRS